MALPLGSLAALSAAAAATAPWREPPRAEYLDAVERELGASPCIGNLDRWERRYAYHQWWEGTVYHLDSAVIEFHLREAGKFGFQSGRKFVDGPS